MDFKGIEIKRLGHSGFLLKEKLNVYIDPFKIPFDLNKADLVLITHDHYDHCSIEDIKKIVKDGTIIVMPAGCQSKVARLGARLEMKIIEPGKQFKVGETNVIGVSAYNINTHFHPKEENWLGYVLEIGEIRVYHAGDTDFIPEMSALGKIDVAFLPVGGTFTMRAEDAVKAALVIKPELAVPMHYELSEGAKEDALKFVDMCKKEGIRAEML